MAECSRLITNCIIIYNTTILSNLLTYRESIGDIEGAAALKNVSLSSKLHHFGLRWFNLKPELAQPFP